MQSRNPPRYLLHYLAAGCRYCLRRMVTGTLLPVLPATDRMLVRVRTRRVIVQLQSSFIHVAALSFLSLTLPSRTSSQLQHRCGSASGGPQSINTLRMGFLASV